MVVPFCSVTTFRMNKKLLALGLAIPLVALAACKPAAPAMDDGASSSSSAMMDDDDSALGGDDGATMQHSSAAAMDDSSGSTDDGSMQARVVPVTVTDWSFSPATVTVKKGENVKLELKGDDGVHSLLVADLGLNVRVEPGSDTVVTLPTDKTGTFEGRCGVPCGPGHRDMKFTIVVE